MLLHILIAPSGMMGLMGIWKTLVVVGLAGLYTALDDRLHHGPVLVSPTGRVL